MKNSNKVSRTWITAIEKAAKANDLPTIVTKVTDNPYTSNVIKIRIFFTPTGYYDIGTSDGISYYRNTGTLGKKAVWNHSRKAKSPVHGWYNFSRKEIIDRVKITKFKED